MKFEVRNRKNVSKHINRYMEKSMVAKVIVLPEERDQLAAIGDVTGIEPILPPARHPTQFQGRKAAPVVKTGHDKRTPAQQGRLAARNVRPVVLGSASATNVQDEEDDVPPAIFVGPGG